MKRYKDKRTIAGNSGLAIVVTLMVITLLITVVVELNHRVRAGGHSAMVFRDRIKLSQMAASGINIGQAVLIQDKHDTEIDSLQEDWAHPETLQEKMAAFPFETGRVKLQINDLCGRIQVNALVNFPEGINFNETQKKLWYRFLQLLDGNEAIEYDIEPLVIINSVKDWLDSGDDEAVSGLEGAESDYYQGLDPPYRCRNGPVVDVTELALVKGVSREIFAVPERDDDIGTFITAFGRSPAERKNGFCFEGTININTAPEAVISALLPLEYAYLGAEIVGYREEQSDNNYVHDLSGKKWYKNVPGCGELTIENDLITLSSDFFEIQATAVLHGSRLTRTVVVHREKDAETGKWYCRVLKCQG